MVRGRRSLLRWSRSMVRGKFGGGGGGIVRVRSEGQCQRAGVCASVF